MLLRLLISSFIMIVVTFVCYFIYFKTPVKKIPKWITQIILGIIFGGLSIMGTELGATIPGATANIRDAAPLLGGFIFGGPVGIIAGLMGGIERFFATYWGRGSATQWACAISTIIAGFYAALLRKVLFQNKRPHWIYGVVAAMVMEIIHFTMVFITKFSTPKEAMTIIKSLVVEMLIANAVALFIPLFVIQLCERDKNKKKNKAKKIATQVQLWLAGSIFVSYLISTTIVYVVQTNTAYQDADANFELTITDVAADVNTNSINYLEPILNKVVERYNLHPYNALKQAECEDYMRELMHGENGEYELASVDLIYKDPEGTFACSSLAGFDYKFKMNMYPESQSAVIHEMMNTVNEETGKIENYFQEFGPQADDPSIWLKYAAASIDDYYYIVISLSKDVFHDVVNEKVKAMTSYRHIKSEGYIMIAEVNYDEDNDLQYYSLLSDAPAALSGKDVCLDLNSMSGELIRHRAVIYGQDSFYMYTTVETYRIIVVLPYDEVLYDRDSSFILNSFMEVLVFAFLYILIYLLLRNSVVNKIDVINKDLGSIISGDLNVKVNVRSSLEFSSLSDDINYTVDALKRYIDEAEKRIDTELAFAKAIQASALPSTFPAFPDKPQFDIHATMDTAKEVGGDFYDFYIIDGDHLAFLIADVSGKGIPAAMFMMESKATLKNLAKTLLSPDEVLVKANDALAQNNEANMFVTCWFGVLNYKTGHVKFANAGHNAPLLYRDGEGWSYIQQKKNMVLAAMEGMPYALQEFDLQPGDRIYLYTDGVTEATRGDKVLYGEDRLVEYLNSHKDDSIKDTLLGVKENIDLFVDGADQFDDITMLGITFKGEKAD